MTAWSCPHASEGVCSRVAGAYCRPGMKGCILAGRVQFPDGALPEPRWPEGKGPKERKGDRAEPG